MALSSVPFWTFGLVIAAASAILAFYGAVSFVRADSASRIRLLSKSLVIVAWVLWVVACPMVLVMLLSAFDCLPRIAGGHSCEPVIMWFWFALWAAIPLAIIVLVAALFHNALGPRKVAVLVAPACVALLSFALLRIGGQV
jgi:hypothetical protein